MGINTFLIDGNVTRDVELQYMPNGVAFATYVIAQNRYWYEGEIRQEATDFYRVTSYRRQAESDALHVRRGRGVTVQGHLRPWYREDLVKGGLNLIADVVSYHAKEPHLPAWFVALDLSSECAEER